MDERETEVVALELVHGETWTFFPESRTYAIRKRLTLADLQRAVAEMTVHLQMHHVPAA